MDPLHSTEIYSYIDYSNEVQRKENILSNEGVLLYHVYLNPRMFVIGDIVITGLQTF